MKTLDTITELGAQALALSNYYELHDANPPALDTYRKVADVLGISPSCTGNSDTAAESVAHTPKAGLVVSFYTFAPAHRGENDVANAYYVATWNGYIYRGDVGLSDRAYHSDNANGFTCFDQSRYTATLPDGCRKLVADIVTRAVVTSGVSLADLHAERNQNSVHYAVSSDLYKAKTALDDALRTATKGKAGN